MELNNLFDAGIVSIFSMLIVFSILILLAFIISMMKYLPGKEEKKATPAAVVNAPAPQAVQTNDEEERMVAMLIASCLAKEEFKGDVQVTSCERVK